MDQAEYDQQIRDIDGFVERGGTSYLMGHITKSLMRIANAQEALVQLANLDLQEAIKEQVEAKAQEVAQEIDAAKTARSFIGKKG